MKIKTFTEEKCNSDIMEEMHQLLVKHVGQLTDRQKINDASEMFRSCLLAMLSKVAVYETSHSGWSIEDLSALYMECFRRNFNLNAKEAMKNRDERLKSPKQ